ncbi:ATP-binding protein [Micromonospora aurantiaca]|uniref:ATP-binding protein n=1 Tax=Micromonospora aurantiaca (nom. illeg.) TaxID=47850 RepID=A0A6N3JWV3_9ACTN|nr:MULTISPECIES: ATP-binding protein [Micromonospora]ADL44155.1 putative anti-sigma regulatory factor, serine/threonine protein kinase [Micromonospora aurantiaca ATCC 27029]ADU06330.1 putative anti-sigma regulatory factor, serine/threonine protein kinase [Micromonospora sp. L5]AXH90388.1 ATP-binding protein [Micromonospora aurantiaca]KAB1116887.1 ATP-binding protein [Micromonospora aurantiaca]MBC9002207.1 ATP-binding protein [Micromonospora aurantiaca]
MGQLRTSPPPPQASELERWVLDSPEDLRGLRASLRDALNRHGLVQGADLDEVPHLVVLVATELASNALRHGRPPTIITLLATDDRFLLDVADHDVSSVPELTDIHPMDSGGRGLFLAQSVSLDVGWYGTEKTKNIWASFSR